jgi:3-hydroxy-9,10-secoandrosta-1,3,5(10)-triene-9,17-dione monooxygenase
MTLGVVGQSAAIPTREMLLARARALAPVLAAARTAANERRDVSAEVIALIDRSGLFDILKPRAFGGYEMDPRVFHEVQNVLAETCMSTAWVFGVLSIQVFVLALFGEQAQQDVWGEGEGTVLVCSSFMPRGSVEQVEGGYRLRGQWPFSSGSSHCQWAIIGSAFPAAEPGEPPLRKLFLIPREDYALVDTWHSFGLRATGSNDVRVEDAFVPDYRSWTMTPGIIIEAGPEVAPLYRLPWLYMFASCVSNLSIGAGRGAVAAFIQSQREFPPRPGAYGGVDTAPLAVARAQAEIEAADVMIAHHVAAMRGRIAADSAMPLSEGLLYRTQLTAMTRKITAAIDELMMLTGGRGVDDDGPLTRTWLDLCAARHHPGNIPDPQALLLGSDSLRDFGNS